METIKPQLLDGWSTHQRMNLLLYDNITDNGMQQSLSKRGGRSIAQQWMHINSVRLQWMEICAKDISRTLKNIPRDAAFNRKEFRGAFEDSSDAMIQLLERSINESGKLKGFKKGVIPFFAYIISHESHHRGNMILTLKQVGEKIPDTIKWRIWEWGK
jgi:uncharacterized damage-inducible protein DinB